MRFVLALAAALGISYLLFSFMQVMIAYDALEGKMSKEYRMVDFIRLDREIDAKDKNREKKKELPKPKEPPKIPKSIIKEQAMPKPKDINTPLPKMDMPLALSKTFSLGDANLGGFQNGMIDNNVIPLVRIPPRYPMRAKRLKLEGYVTLAFVIDEEGRVEAVDILESKPESLFDKAAIDSIKRWKFKPKSEQGVPVKQKAVQTIEFKLEDQ